jgi:hypothetical protein
MMPESEFKSLSEGEGMEELKQQFKRRKDKTRQQEHSDKLNEKKPKQTRPNRTSKKISTGIDISDECQPTSSKVRIEDLVTDEDEEIEPRMRKLWDRPVPPPEHRWVTDHRLPRELNELNAAMWEYNWQQFTPQGEEYRDPDTNEISQPTEFIARIRDEPL